MQRSAAVVLTALALVWTAALVAAPFAASRGVASPFVLFLYEAAGLLCHQRPERSFHLAGVALPVCARCAGLYASSAAGALAAWAFGAGRQMPSPKVRLALAVAALPTLVSVAVEWLGVMQPSAVSRAIAAAPLGMAAGFVIVMLLRIEGQGLPFRA